MSKLDELIKKLCPNGVEYKRIGDFANILRGKRLTKNELFKKDKYAVFHGGLEPLGCYSKANRPANSVMIINVGASAGTVGFCTEEFWSSDGCYCISQTDDILQRFLYFVLLNNQHYLISRVRKAGIPTLDAKVIKNIEAPVPPLVIQREIVRILDNFTELTAKLTANLTTEFNARKKQYEYYRDSLLNFGEGVPMVKLEDIATDIYRGAGIKRNEVTTEGVPCIRYGEIYTSYNISFTECLSHTKKNIVRNPKWLENGDIIFTITGENVEEISKSIAYLGHEKCIAGGDTVVLKHKQEPRYVSYALSTTFAQNQKSKGRIKSKVVHSSVPILKKIEIPLPDWATQTRIADSLDNFRSIIDSIYADLSAEIIARQKQYEYYRDKLLTFKELPRR